jgi:hypothetical protein
MQLQSHNLTAKNAVLEAKLNNINKQINGLMGFESPSRTIHSITRQLQCDHDYCAPTFSQVNLLLNTVVIGLNAN